VGCLVVELGSQLGLGYDGYESACTTFVFIATFPRSADNELTM